jgi:hypothetical protein
LRERAAGAVTREDLARSTADNPRAERDRNPEKPTLSPVAQLFIDAARKFAKPKFAKPLTKRS